MKKIYDKIFSYWSDYKEPRIFKKKKKSHESINLYILIVNNNFSVVFR